ncbi:hypothetical protein PAERUG_E16_London_17_VIM_2_04_14_06005 [Pseudomonas aeruginosa]|nr:hypothetical protein PAERUG_E16_London_17_VIM_2_04_14_06005 [Pseudomonas aeruginosa]
MRTADAGHVVLGLAVLQRNRVAAGVALIVLALAKIVAHGHAVVEYEAVAAPQALFLRHLFEVLEDAALEVEDLLETGAEHVAGSLLAADAAGAEHRHLLVPRRVVVGLDVLGELAERPGLRIDRALEGADRHLVVVAGIDQQDFRIADQGIPVLRLDILADLLVRIDARHAEGDDFLLQLDLGAVERLFVAVGFLVLDIGQPGIAAQPGEQRIDAFAATGDGAVDAFLGQQQGAFHTVVEQGLQQGFTQRHVIVESHELVQRRHDDGCHGDIASRWSPA